MTTFSYSSLEIFWERLKELAWLLQCNKLHDVRLPLTDCPCNAGPRAATQTTCHIIGLKRHADILRYRRIPSIKDNNEFWHLVNSDRAQISQDFMVNILIKISGLQKLLDAFFTKLLHPKKN